MLLNAQNIRMTLDKGSVLKEPNPPILLDKSMMRVQYKQSIINDTVNPTKKTENTMLLQVGKNVSKYSDYNKLIGDSLVRVYSKQGLDMNTILGKTSVYLKNTFGENIFKNYPEGKTTSTDFFTGTPYLYEELLVKVEWKLENGDLTVCGYKCKKASATLFGRKYTAWYTRDIPVSDGPWKFAGLPGLILKVEDDMRQVSFECVAIDKPHWSDQIYMSDRDYIKTNKNAFLKSYKQYRENPGAVLQNSGMVTDLPANALRKRAYNPIELSE
jgi:GLPGLI family protein